MNLVFILILHYASAGNLYDTAAVIGPVAAATCTEMHDSNTNDGVYVSCSTGTEVNVALESYGCKAHTTNVHDEFTEIRYACKG
jgi:hypothetical protein